MPFLCEVANDTIQDHNNDPDDYNKKANRNRIAVSSQKQDKGKHAGKVDQEAGQLIFQK